ncbi:hypothetical protein [Rossellomorea aquimaris]|uniref:hypothetical protein n=1 Tax=Rossellomorea aquimaris TaxID=189382 RepID=UPI0012DFEC36|nr:hypothetical protein [Rossellomorea aquimaris]
MIYSHNIGRLIYMRGSYSFSAADYLAGSGAGWAPIPLKNCHPEEWQLLDSN